MARAYARWAKVPATTTPPAGSTGSASTGPGPATAGWPGGSRSPDRDESPPVPVPDPAVHDALMALPLSLRSVVVCRLLLDWSVADTAAAARGPPRHGPEPAAPGHPRPRSLPRPPEVTAMPFEQMLRDRLLDEAESVPLPHRDAGRAIARARARRHRRTAAVSVTAAVAVATAAVSLVQQGGAPRRPRRHPRQRRPARHRPPRHRLAAHRRRAVRHPEPVPAGRRHGVRAVDRAGRPLRRPPRRRPPQVAVPLGEDGTWREIPLEGDRPRLIVATGAEGRLYGVGTGPAAEGGGRVARLLTSGRRRRHLGRRGRRRCPSPPSTAHDWRRSMAMAVDSTGTTTLALVRTSYFPDVAALFPETDGEPATRSSPREGRPGQGLVPGRLPVGLRAAEGERAPVAEPWSPHHGRRATGPGGRSASDPGAGARTSAPCRGRIWGSRAPAT